MQNIQQKIARVSVVSMPRAGIVVLVVGCSGPSEQLYSGCVLVFTVPGGVLPGVWACLGFYVWF